MFEQFLERLAKNLKFGDELESAFVYAPDIDDYVHVASIFEAYDIPIPSISS